MILGPNSYLLDIRKKRHKKVTMFPTQYEHEHWQVNDRPKGICSSAKYRMKRTKGAKRRGKGLGRNGFWVKTATNHTHQCIWLIIWKTRCADKYIAEGKAKLISGTKLNLILSERASPWLSRWKSWLTNTAGAPAFLIYLASCAGIPCAIVRPWSWLMRWSMILSGNGKERNKSKPERQNIVLVWEVR